ncbi:11450_t:CDS:1, partial [Entrophospora sp. SA101]
MDHSSQKRHISEDHLNDEQNQQTLNNSETRSKRPKITLPPPMNTLQTPQFENIGSWNLPPLTSLSTLNPKNPIVFDQSSILAPQSNQQNQQHQSSLLRYELPPLESLGVSRLQTTAT